ncbi:COG2958 family protein [Thiohalophilus sp.]|uniref:COG2958 family protein n=1 Tax=Thiohalophilus sp. TaxID=3028392 RepID=UPI002ACEBFE2|nr:HTH domain-containing protein [Thiohalophilus sp.]MDZ7662511.1 HTH domain-containing protein [Thiohalophilus sp.]
MSFTFTDYAVEVLVDADKPLTYQEIWEIGKNKGLDQRLNTTGKTPWQTLGARLFVEVRDNPRTEFIKIGSRPARFFLKARASQLPDDIIEKIEVSERKEREPKSKYTERDLHPLLSYFAYTNPTFSRGKSILTKTIFHEKSKKHGYSEWSHPDLVGFHLPLEDWNPDLIEFNRISDNNALKLFSFELKKSITKGNYREAFFQAVSNSSWANEGYLIAAEIKQDDELLSELERLSMSFGIGVIHLDLNDIDSSGILYHAKYRPQLDWETMNKLSEQNDDFRQFIKDVKIDFDSKRIHKSEYDSVIEDPESYIKKIRGC